MFRQLCLVAIVTVGSGHIHSTDVGRQSVTVSDRLQTVGDSHVCPDYCNCDYNTGQIVAATCSGDVTDDLGPSLLKLSLSNCHSVQLQSYSLEHLTLDNCTVGDSVMRQLTKLTSLTISNSILSGDKLELPCRSLTSLSLVGLGLGSLPSLCPTLPLVSLNLTDNQLTSLPWDQLESFPLLSTVDISYNPQLSDLSPPKSKFFHLTSLYLRGNTGLITLCNSLLHSMPNLRSLDISQTSLSNLPTELLLMPHLTTLTMGNFQPPCTCELSATLLQSDITHHPLFSSLECRLPNSDLVSLVDHRLASMLDCSPATIQQGDTWQDNLTKLASDRIVLDCEAVGNPAPVLIWLSPRYELLKLRPDPEPGCEPVEEEIVLNENIQDYSQWTGHLTVLSNGSLVIDSFGWRDRGTYTCYVDNSFGNESVSININLDYHYRNVIYYWSLVFGFCTAAVFLALTLLGKLLHHLLWNYGCSCCCGCSSNPPPRTKRLTNVVDSIETYRIQQLEKLRESYTQQSQKIRDNYSLQIERMREQYTNQTRGVGESYQTAKEQYLDQINKLREYSNGQLARTHENYIFQRQRLRKFSAQNYLKIRETGKYTQKTLNRVIENMPALYMDLTSCRQGQPGMPDSWQSEAEGVDEMDDTKSPNLEMIPDESQSVYFTPSGTPQRDNPMSPGGRNEGGKKGHKRMVSNLSNFFPFWWGMGQSNEPGTTVAIVESGNDQISTNETIEVNHSDIDEEDVELPADIEKQITNHVAQEVCQVNHVSQDQSVGPDSV